MLRLDQADKAEPGQDEEEAGDELEARIVEPGEEEEEDGDAVGGA